MTGAVARLPIRLRLTVVTGGAMAALLGLRESLDAASVGLPVALALMILAAVAVTYLIVGRLLAPMERERCFVGDAGHELRTPLTALRGELEVALLVDGSRDDWRRAVESAMQETDRVIGLAESLLALARGQDGRLPLVPEIVDAAELLARVADRARAIGAAPGAIAIECESGLTLEADPAWAEQALLNLVHNAIRYGDGPITVSAAVAGGRAELHVRDEGPGFPDTFLPRAFERFSRAGTGRPGGGSGLGLAIVQTVARAHGGTAHARNRHHGGADVWFSVPGHRVISRPVPTISPRTAATC